MSDVPYVRRGVERGHRDYGWLDTRHTFSFGGYYDPAHLGFSRLRVINEDTVAPGRGFDAHDHRDMEIITYVREGALEHRDSLGNGSVIAPGEVQRMSAGTGIRHSEFNASKDRSVRFLQIWIEPEAMGIEPAYEQRAFDTEQCRGNLVLLLSRGGRSGSLTIHQDVDLYAAELDHAEVIHNADPGRDIWVQIVDGTADVDGVPLVAGDGIGFNGKASEWRLAMRSSERAHILLFDMLASVSARRAR